MDIFYAARRINCGFRDTNLAFNQLPASPLIENAPGRRFCLFNQRSCTAAFPIKASDYTSRWTTSVLPTLDGFSYAKSEIAPLFQKYELQRELRGV
jgi:hypothetical protein